MLKSLKMGSEHDGKKLKQPRKTNLCKGRILDAHIPPPDARSLWINLKLWKTHQNCHLFLACPFFHSQVPWSTAFTGDIPIVSYSCPMHVWLQHITTSLQLHSLRIHPGETALVTPYSCWQSALRISGSKLTSKDKARMQRLIHMCFRSLVTLVVHPQGSYAYRIHGLEGVRGKGWRVGVSDCWDSNEQTDIDWWLFNLHRFFVFSRKRSQKQELNDIDWHCMYIIYIYICDTI